MTAAAAERPATAASAGAVWSALAAVYVIWGSTYLGIALAIETMPPLLANAGRFFAAAALLAGWVALRRGPRRLAVTPRRLGSATLVGVMLLGVGIGTLALAERYVPSGVAALIVAVIPLWVVLIRLVAGDRPAGLTLLGTAVGLGGLAWMLTPGGTEPVGGSDSDVVVWSLAMIGSTFCWAYFSWLSPRLPMPADALVMTVYELLGAGVLLAGLGLARGERLDLSAYSATSWLGWAYLVVVGSVVGYTAYVWLLGRAPISLVATYAYVNPVVAVLLGLVVLGEPLTSDVVVGMTVVLGGVVLVLTGERSRRGRGGPLEPTEPPA